MLYIFFMPFVYIFDCLKSCLTYFFKGTYNYREISSCYFTGLFLTCFNPNIDTNCLLMGFFFFLFKVNKLIENFFCSNCVVYNNYS